ncbi:class I adenylate-forming enzyme family protein [Nocardia sp. 348MFTsu5.1]|uniref:class I adenylate-forming enzyme family protein n=1 Tax=Nocardia sp. 348MFTsu5.1 TaxID=1172185 RepID=UPI00036321DF|nr:class I adenylate-forming enzyme family protein [Nocardia sp. 348MFTsu5.1]
MPEDVAVEAETVIATYREIEHELTAVEAPFETVEIAGSGGVIRSYRHVPENFYDVAEAIEEQFADNMLTVSPHAWTYGEVFARARRLAAALEDRYGIGPGDRVGIMMANQPYYLVSLLAITRIGAVAVLYNSRASRAEIGSATSDVRSSVIIADPKRIALIEQSDCDSVLISTESIEGMGVATLADLIDGADKDSERNVVSPESVCMILFTSGTSGRAKGVLLTHRNLGNVVLNMRYVLECNLRFAARQYGISVDEIRALMPPVSSLLIFPLFHVSGFAALMVTMQSGGLVATMEGWDPERAAGLVEEHKLTLMAGPPMVVDELLMQPSAQERLGSLMNVVPGGQVTPPNVKSKIATTLPNAQRSSGWGMTETGGSVCTANGALLGIFPDTLGPLSPTMDARVMDADGHEVPSGSVGELEIRGGLVMAGYAGPDGLAVETPDNWFRTGDLGFIDEFGLVYVVDRAKDIVISAGENISCVEIENVLIASDWFVEVAAFGVPDARLGERLVAVVTLRDGQSVTGDDIRGLARESLPEYKIPTEIIFDAGPLPRNATGKLVKRVLRATYLERHHSNAGVG